MSIRRLLTETASVLRAQINAYGIKGDYVVHIEELRCTPLDPVDPETREKMLLKSPYELFQVTVNGDLDIRKNDYLVMGTKEYPVQKLEKWMFRGTPFFILYVEDIANAG
jgi:hypothetical protein